MTSKDKSILSDEEVKFLQCFGTNLKDELIKKMQDILDNPNLVNTFDKKLVFSIAVKLSLEKGKNLNYDVYFDSCDSN